MKQLDVIKNMHIVKNISDKVNYIAKKMPLRLWSFFRIALIVCLCFVIMYPLLYMITITFREVKDLHDSSVVWIPKNFTFVNLVDTFTALDYPNTLLTTTLITAVSSVLLVVSCAITGYGFARFNFKGKNLLFAIVLFTIIVPAQTYIMPMYMDFKYFDFFGLNKILSFIMHKDISVNLIGTLWTFYLPAALGSGIRSGLFIYIFRQFFRSLPNELEDAAYIDGCGIFQTFLQVMIPNVKPAFISVILLSTVWYWNDYLFSGMLLGNLRNLTISLLSLESLLTSSLKEIPDVYVMLTRTQAGCLLVILPLIMMYIILQKNFTQSIERTGIVG